MKWLFVTLLIGVTLEAQARSNFKCVTDFNDPVYSAIKATAEAIQKKNFLPNGIGVGRCMDLKNSNVLTPVMGPNPLMPDECMGISFPVFGDEYARALAETIIKIDNPLINGRRGLARVKYGTRILEVPICTDDFSAGGPQ